MVDSSVIVKWVNRDNELELDQADKLLSDVQAGKVDLIAPDLAKYEVGNALMKKGIEEMQALQNLDTIYSLPIKFVSETEELASDTYRLANKVRLVGGSAKFTYYDASFAALAKQENATLVTANPKHQTKIPGIEVVPLESYQ